MPKVTWISHQGTPTTLEVNSGDSLMDAALFGGVDAIEGACGGLLSCATCHVMVDPAWEGKLPAPADDELSMLEMVSEPRQPNSRLSCQLVMRDDLDGLVLYTPASQG
jgi:ferredoxin, 2Fe-2S